MDVWRVLSVQIMWMVRLRLVPLGASDLDHLAYANWDETSLELTCNPFFMSPNAGTFLPCRYSESLFAGMELWIYIDHSSTHTAGRRSLPSNALQIWPCVYSAILPGQIALFVWSLTKMLDFSQPIFSQTLPSCRVRPEQYGWSMYIVWTTRQHKI